MRILLVEDDELLGDGIQTALQQDGHTVEWIKDGKTAEMTILHEVFDAVLLDLGLPRMPGLEVLRSARKAGVTTPIMILTAHDAIEERVKGLDSGADDYLSKPFDLSEILARIRAITRRSTGRANPTISHGEIVLDLS